MKTSKKSYSKMVLRSNPKTKIVKDCFFAFFIGGSICLAGELLFTLYSFLGLAQNEISFLVSATLIISSGILTLLGLYQKLGAKAGAGTLVPITGFANAVVSPAIEFKTEGLVTGAAAKMFLIAGPVLVFSALISSIIGLVYYFFAL